MTTKPSPPKTAAARTGRRVALALYYVLVVAISLTGAVEITWQAFFQPPAPASVPDCKGGLHVLYGAVVRARNAAAGVDGEEAALARYRAALDPEWRERDAIAALCKGSEADEGALDAIEHLRYAEEHAVRRAAGELAPLRRRVQAIVERDEKP